MIADEGLDTSWSAEVGADQGVDQEDPSEELSPQLVPAASSSLSRRVGDAAELGLGRSGRIGNWFDVGLGWRWRGSCVVCGAPIGGLVCASRQRHGRSIRSAFRSWRWRPRWHEAVAPRRCGSEHAAVVGELLARASDERREPLEECEGVESVAV